MKRSTTLVIPESLYETLTDHLFPGDEDEHAAVIAAGLVKNGAKLRLLARDIFIADEECDYRPSNRGYKALQATFIHKCITYCRDQRLVYLAVHNHSGIERVSFSRVDYESHERGYPALLDIAEGMPVGALVFARRAVELDLWLPNGRRSALCEARVIGDRLERLYARPRTPIAVEIKPSEPHNLYDRQVLMFGLKGQQLLRSASVGVVGLGGIGSLVNEYIARLGVGKLVLVDPDRLETSNLSRVVGATAADLPQDDMLHGTKKVSIAARMAREAQPEVEIRTLDGDFAEESVARELLDCDFIFLAADTMRARLVFNAIVHQYFIPGMQLGSKILSNQQDGTLEAAYSVVRKVGPGIGCLLCNQLIDAAKLAEEWKTDRERLDQRYGTESANPSVITMNGISAAHAVNDFLFYFLGLTRSDKKPPYKRFDHLSGSSVFEQPRRDTDCGECSRSKNSRFGVGDAHQLPCAEGARFT